MGKKLIVITGQTATGKTKLALQKAQDLHGNLINADSRQIYKELTIISGKDIESNNYQRAYTDGPYNIGFYTLQGTPVWLYDIISIHQVFSSHDFVSQANKLILQLLDKDITPIIVGGTYLYIYHMLYGIDKTVPADNDLRSELADKSVEELQHILMQKNETLFNQLNNSDKHNPHRLIRKIEQASEHIEHVGLKTDFTYTLPSLLSMPELETEVYGMYQSDKEKLKEQIRKRVTNRIDNGAIDEVKQLIGSGCTGEEPGLKTIGYDLITQFIQGAITKEMLIDLWSTREIQYAKRQYTFMKRDPNIKWLAPT